MKTPIITTLLAGALAVSAIADDEVVVTVDANQTWLGYMNVFELPANGGGFVFGSGWGTADLVAVFSGTSLVLSPNVIGDPNPFWYQGGGAPGSPGNKIMEANMYVEETGTHAGKTVVFNGNVAANTLTEAHVAIAYIKDFAPDYSSFEETTVVLDEPGEFSISLETINDPDRHVQFGFQVVGPNVWFTDVEPFGEITIDAIATEPVDPNFTVDASANWLGFMNVYRLPEPDDDGTQLFGIFDALPPEALTAVFGDGTLTLTPFPYSTELGLDDWDWYIDFGDDQGIRGFRWMEANMYVDLPATSLTGQTVTFSGEVLANTLTGQHESFAFIKEYNADYSSFTESRIPLTPGPFTIQHEISPDPTGRVQYGFQTTGPNVWPDDLALFGSVVVQAGGVTPSDAFTAWIDTFDFSNFTSPDLSPDGDPDGDGRSNLLEFALDDDPTNPASSGKMATHIETINGGNALVLTLPVRGNPEFSGAPALTASADGVSYTIEGSDNLAAFDQPVSEIVPTITTGMPALNDGWNYRSFRLDGDIDGDAPRGPQGFLRASISSNP